MGSAPRRLAFCGNIGNTHYQIVKALRSAGHDAHLFIGSDDPLWYRPESDDPELAGNYPDWIHEGDWLRPLHGLIPHLSPLVAELNAFDLVVASGTFPVLVQLSSTPFCFLSTGADLTVTPFPWRSRHRRAHWLRKIGYFGVAFWQRRALRSAAEIWTQPFEPFIGALRTLGIDPAAIACDGVRLAIDTDVFSRSAAATSNVEHHSAEIQARSDFVVFHPTRLVFAEDAESMRTGQAKGSTTTMQAFAMLVKRCPDRRPLLVLPERGPDLQLAKNLARELEIEDHIYWAGPPRADGFSRNELVALYSISDAVIDEFGAGWFGYVSLEAMSCAVPVVSRLDGDALRRMYADPTPWLEAPDAEAAADRLCGLAESPADAREQGERSREWVVRHHSSIAVHDHYVQLCEAGLRRALDPSPVPATTIE